MSWYQEHLLSVFPWGKLLCQKCGNEDILTSVKTFSGGANKYKFYNISFKHNVHIFLSDWIECSKNLNLTELKLKISDFKEAIQPD